MKANEDWKLVKNGVGKYSEEYFYCGVYKDIVGCKVSFCKGKWTYVICEKYVKQGSVQNRWINKGSGWKRLKTALFKACLGVGDVVYQLKPELFEN